MVNTPTYSRRVHFDEEIVTDIRRTNALLHPSRSTTSCVQLIKVYRYIYIYYLCLSHRFLNKHDPLFSANCLVILLTMGVIDYNRHTILSLWLHPRPAS